MKRATFWLFLIGVAVAGFAIGRMTGNAPLPAANTREEFPLLPAPPKTNGYQTISAPQPEKELIVEVPIEGAEIAGDSIDVAGRAKIGRQTVVLIAVKAADGAMLASTEARIEGELGSYGRFGATIPLAAHQTGKASVEVTLRTADGVKATETRTFTFVEPNTVPVRVYFTHSEDTAGGSCDLVRPVDRLVSSKVAVYRAVIEMLLKGPILAEKNAGYFTSIPTGVVLKSVAADAQGVVTADFNEALQRGVAGSCRVVNIRTQITVTLRQFPEVRDVVISINGRTEDILQP